ncbi:MAG: LAGLIDADG family homing endonuclease, partial [Halobacteria archaeon]|nr:LAGLIDADG family homing endonuclease [Halobacteria archaeon]
MTKKELSNYVYRESIPAELLLEVYGSINDVLCFVPDGVKLGIKRDNTEISRIIEVNEDVATLLGYYAAEGFAREQETPKGTIHQTTFCGTEDGAREFYMRVLRDEFGVEPYEENYAKVTVSGRLMRTFFDTVLDAGIYAHTKRVPQCVFDASPDIIGAYLSGYFSGDGSVSKKSLSIKATTVSQELKEDILALLTRLGVKGRVSETESKPLMEHFPDYYDDFERLSAPRYRISISSHDVVEFSEQVGFHLQRKNRVLGETTNSITPSKRRVFDGGNDDIYTEPIASVEYRESDTSHVYCLTVEDTHSFVANDIANYQCDGDEDCVMLLM